MHIHLKAGIILALSLMPTAVFAQQMGDAQNAKPDPEKQALAFEVQECTASKVRTTTQAFALQAQVDTLRKKVEEAEARAKAAEDKAGKPEEPPANK